VKVFNAKSNCTINHSAPILMVKYIRYVRLSDAYTKLGYIQLLGSNITLQNWQFTVKSRAVLVKWLRRSPHKKLLSVAPGVG
jgi:hypothetical protein